ncbi:hypothetical protein O0I10_010993 [Lichtheimia ornata]|uniref:Uncharacterized protein n=1 Tax=Lichtheimia ornata TaxID=688661 RepID=A0AAD7UVC0_9FUNG|nr:uncharacterized protein O0I10_010993 [Lichtheimia ornata]KAJ8653342.1 hypothetical protein O0I10_010993 [Lichtheimia ornata]
MAYLFPKSAGDDCVIQRDHCRELLVFWCFGVNHVSHGEVFMSLVVSTFIASRVVGYQATGDFSGESQPMNFYEWIVSATSNSMHTIGAISSFIPSSGSSRYRQLGGHPEMKVSYRLITSATRNNLYIFDISNLSISWWFWLSAIPLMDLYNYTCLMDGSCHQQEVKARVQVFCVTKVIHASRQGLHRQAAFHTQ